MFGRKYINYTYSDFLTSFIIFLIFAIIFGIIFIYVGYIGLIIILSIAIIIGLFYAIYIYIKNLIFSIKKIKGSPSASSKKLINVILKWIMLMWDTTKQTFIENFLVARNAITKSHYYKFFSLKKWLWLLVAPATLIFGTILIFGLAILQISIILLIFLVCFSIAFIILSIILLISICYSIIVNIINLKIALKGQDNIFTSFHFTKFANFKSFVLSLKKYFLLMWIYIKLILLENIMLIKSNLSMASTYSFISFKKWFLYFSVVPILIYAIIFIIIMTIVLLLICSILIILNFLWIVILLLVKALKRH